MLLIRPETLDPYLNLALEEVLLKGGKEEYIILSVNEKSVIIGKHQSLFREVNPEFVYRNRIPVLRRISGGGTVYHDPGNINFAFLTNSEEGKQVDFRRYTKPVIDFLQSLRIYAGLYGTSDIKTDGHKISGNAGHVFRNRVLHHGTLLFDASLENLRGSIRTDQSSYLTRAIGSNPSSVINLKEKLKSVPTTESFINQLAAYLLSTLEDLEPAECSSDEQRKAEELAGSKYRTWEWNYAYGPEYSFTGKFMLNGELHNCVIHVKKGIIAEARIEGSGKMESIAPKLAGCRHMPEDIIDFFRKENAGLSDEEIFNFF